MTAQTYAAALAHVLVSEGGYSDHPSDPGGATMKGITQRVYDAWRAGRGLARQPVRRIADAEVSTIYREQYADRIRYDDLPAGVDLAVFDAAVNSGPVQAAKWLQRALGVDDDGAIGAVTLAAARKVSALSLIDGICDRRLGMLRGLRTWPVFGRGWGSRVDRVRKAAKAMT